MSSPATNARAIPSRTKSDHESTTDAGKTTSRTRRISVPGGRIVGCSISIEAPIKCSLGTLRHGWRRERLDGAGERSTVSVSAAGSAAAGDGTTVVSTTGPGGESEAYVSAANAGASRTSGGGQGARSAHRGRRLPREALEELSFDAQVFGSRGRSSRGEAPPRSRRRPSPTARALARRRSGRRWRRLSILPRR